MLGILSSVLRTAAREDRWSGHGLGRGCEPSGQTDGQRFGPDPFARREHLRDLEVGMCKARRGRRWR